MTKAFVGRYLSRWLSRLGRAVARHPLLFLFGILIFTGIQCLGWLRFYHMQDFDYIFFIKNGQTERDRHSIEQLFPLNNSENIDLGRLTQVLRGAVVLVRPKDGESIFREEVAKEILDLNENMYKISVESDGRTWNFSDLCAKWWFGSCIHNSALEILHRLKDFRSGRFKPTYPVDKHSFKDSLVSITAGSLGGVETDAQNHITSAKAVRFVFQLDFRKKELKAVNYAWEKKFLHELQRMEFKHVELSLFTSLSVSEELTQATLDVLPLCVLAGFAIICFSVCSCMSTNWIISKPWLGVVSAISASLCVTASFGFVMMCGVPYIDIVLSVPFLMLGIGIDDSFVLIACWRRTNSKDSVEKRMGETYSEAAVSITLTSMTNFLSFCVGLATPFRVTQIYSVYAMTAIVFCYIYEIFFFGACLALSGYREKKKLHPLTFQPVFSKTEAEGKNLLSKLFCYGEDTDLKFETVWIMVFFRDQFSNLLIKKCSKYTILLVYGLYLAVSIYGFCNIKEGIDYKIVFRYHSYGWKYMDWNYRYFTDYPHRIQIVINKTLDYSDPAVQQKVENLLQKFENASFCAGREFTESWLRTYKDMVNGPGGWLLFRGYNISNRKDFNEGLEILFRIKIFEKLATDVIFDKNQTNIMTSRFIIHSKNVHTSHQEKMMLNQLYKIAEESEYPVIVYNLLFPVIEQMLYIVDISIQTGASAVAIMVFTFFIFVPSLKCALFVAMTIVSIQTGTLGLMTFWGINLDALSLLSLIMCMGFCVDFVAHVSYAYLACDKPNSREKIRYSLFSTGMPILQGAISTIIGVFFLIFARTYSFVIFFKIIFIVMVLATLHAIFILPILLSFADDIVNVSRMLEHPNSVEEAEELNSTRENQNKS